MKPTDEEQSEEQVVATIKQLGGDRVHLRKLHERLLNRATEAYQESKELLARLDGVRISQAND